MRKDPDINFVNLHSHTTFSIFDGLGYPQDHLDYIWENGCDAYAITDHGTMSALPYQVKAIKRFREEGKDVKPIYGVEAYVIPSLEEWKEVYEAKGSEEINATIIEAEDTKEAIDSIINERRHMVLLAQNQEGLQNIYKLISDSYREENFYRFPRMDYEMLREYSDGVIATSSCLGGVYAGDYWDHREDGDESVLSAMSETSDVMLDIFGDRWYAEVQWNAIQEQHELNKYVIKIADRFDIPLVSNADAHYPSPDKWEARELYKQLGWMGKDNESIKDSVPDSRGDLECELYPKNGDQMFADYKKYSEEMGFKYDDDLIRDSIERTHHIAHDRIEDFYPDDSVKLPSFAEPDGDQTAPERLRELAEAGLRERKGGSLAGRQEYRERLDMELEVIEEKGFSRYFLAFKTIVDVGKENFLFGPGRGSGASSLTAYLIGITEVDPIEHNLIFSRFLRKDQEGYPDIDLDVSDRDELREHLIDKWGRNSVAAVSNYNTLQVRSVLKDISKYEGVEFSEVNDVTEKMMEEATPKAKQANGIEAGFYEPTYEECKEFSPTLRNFLQKHPEIDEHAEDLIGQCRNISRHAGGLVITDELDKKMPLITSKDVRQTPWSEGARRRDLEPLGFIKFDLLGLKTLRVFEDCIEKILKGKGKNPSFSNMKEFYNQEMHPDVIDYDDQEVYENVFAEGNWAGIFQFTSSGMQELSERIKPRSIEEIAVVSAIYRPGPLNSGVDERYVKAKQNPEIIEYRHPLMRDITEKTYGFIIFQEQIAQTAHKLGKDISLDEGNLFMKILTKKGLPEEKRRKKEKITDRFMEGCIKKGLDRWEAEDLLREMEEFSKYGFNLSHSTAYSIISYQCAWLYTHYTAEWVAAFLDNEGQQDIEEAISIAEEAGFDISLPNVNESSNKWEVGEGETLLQPLTDVKGVGSKAYEQILEYRPFGSVEQIFLNDDIDYRPLDKRVIGRLIKTRALDPLMDDRFESRKHMFLSVSEENPDNEKQLKEAIEKHEGCGEFSRKEVIEAVTEFTGVYPIEKIVDAEMRKRLHGISVPPLGLMEPMEGGKNFCWFIIRDKDLRKASNGNFYWVLTVTDITNEVNTIKCWGAKKHDPVHEHHAYMADLNYDSKWGFDVKGFRDNMKLLK